MWFKQSTLLKLSAPVPFETTTLSEQLAPLAFTPCLPSLATSYGWAPPQDEEHAPLVVGANGYLLLSMQTEEKILPASVVRHSTQVRVKEIENQEMRQVGASERRRLKDDITAMLLPRAFSKYSHTMAVIDCQNGWLILNTTQLAKIEKFVKLFHRCTSIQAQPVETKKISALLTYWLTESAFPDGLSVETSGVLRDPRQQARTIRCKNQDLSATGIQSLLKDGCEIHELGLIWQDRVTFNLVDDFTLKSIRYDEKLLSLAESDDTEAPEQQFYSDFMIMSDNLQQLWQLLMSELSMDASTHSLKRVAA